MRSTPKAPTDAAIPVAGFMVYKFVAVEAKNVPVIGSIVRPVQISAPPPGGNSIKMDVINNGTEIDTLELYVNWGGACGVAGVKYYFYDISISGGHFYKSQGAGETNVSGDFTSSTTASGDFFAYLDTGSCTASRSGTWTANYVP